mmetsp:Transcript_55605/g.126388  ORF Transcript_55605/g.126388 Transcript_55605/m.126388 type:complete len:275 (-) Transcript_55605:95-919(-)
MYAWRQCMYAPRGALHVLLADGGEVGLDLGLAEGPEAPALRHEPHLQVRPFEVRRKHVLKAHNGGLHSLIIVRVRNSRNFFFEPVSGLVALGARGGGLVREHHARRVDLEELRPPFVVHRGEDGGAGQHPKGRLLRVNLADVCDPLREHVHGHVVSEVELELVRLLTHSRNLDAAVGGEAGHEAADLLGDLVHVRHRGRVNEAVRDFLLDDEGARFLPAHANRREPRGVRRTQSILNLVQMPLRRKDSNVPVIVVVARHFEYPGSPLWSPLAQK